jgi:hypothetical protein
MLKKAAIVAALLMFVSLPAFCGSIDFQGSGDGGTWSWNGTGPLTATTLGMSVKVVGSPNTYKIYMPFESFTSGSFLGGSGTTSNPWMFGPGSSDSFTITGCVPPATTCSPATLFTGEFAGSGEMAVQGTGSMLFSSTFTMGTVDPALLSFLGFSTSQVNFAGTYSVTLSGNAPGSGLVASGDLVLSPTPEPASLTFVAIGLLGFGTMAFRRKLLRV